jgi:cytochrome c553
VRWLRKGRWAFLAAALFSFPSLAQNLQLCESCHGPGGNSVQPGIPSIAGQPRLFMENQLVLFREGIRKSPVMTPLMAGIPDKEVVALSEHFAKQAVKAEQGTTDKKLFAQGQALAKKLRCGVCHLADFTGQKQMPRLAGQREDYLLSEMKAYRDNQRPDTTMTAALYGVKEDEMKALAHFLSRTAPKPKPAAKK